MAYYPVFLDLSGRCCAVVGGGIVAERKVEGLLQSGARVKLISPRLTERLGAWAAEGKIQHVSRPYQPGDLTGCDLAFAATDDHLLNRVVHEHAQSQGVWMNAADDPEHCDFILPAVIRRGELTLAVSTGGATPAAARVVREELEACLSEDLALLVRVAAEVRRELRKRTIEVSAARWHEALTGDFRRLIDAGRAAEARKLLLDEFGAES